MKKIMLFLTSILLVGCSLFSSGADKGWDLIKENKGEGYYQDCQYIHFHNLASQSPDWSNNRFDGKVFYAAAINDYSSDYYIYIIKTNELRTADFMDWYEAHTLSRGFSDDVCYTGIYTE